MDFLNRKNRVRTFKKKASVDINFFQHPKWQIVTLLEQYSGLWSYQNKLKQYFLQTLFFLTLLVTLLAVANRARQFLGVDIEMSIECIITFLLFFSVFFKLTLASIFQNRKQKVYEKVSKHFKVITDAEEAKVLEKCANQGFKFTVIYIGVICVSIGLYDTIPNVVLFYHYFFANHELKLTLPVQMDYGVNHQKHWFCIMVHFLLFAYGGTFVDITCDLSFILQTRHVQALFKIVGLRLNKISEFIEEFENEITSDDAIRELHSLISSTINLHSECFEVVEMMENTYTINWFIVLLLNAGVFGAGIHLATLRWHDPVETLRNCCAFAILLVHFYTIFYHGQLLIDSSSSISYTCYDCKWYKLPTKSCKLLHMIMIQATRPCQLTGGQFFPLSMQSFSKMLKAGVSYYTVFQT